MVPACAAAGIAAASARTPATTILRVWVGSGFMAASLSARTPRAIGGSPHCTLDLRRRLARAEGPRSSALPLDGHRVGPLARRAGGVLHRHGQAQRGAADLAQPALARLRQLHRHLGGA